MAPQNKDLTPRFGIGEWFGKVLTQMDAEERTLQALDALKDKGLRESRPCPFQPNKPGAICNKDGGICSLRLYSYRRDDLTGKAIGESIADPKGALRATCPNRFHEEGEIFRWIGEVMLGDPSPRLVSEVGFLEADATTDSPEGDDVGRIDMVLVSNVLKLGCPIDWCAVEIQAVYFSGDAMRPEYKALAEASREGVVFPVGRRRPDYRSSGPKRLMPQLQIKVPTLRRWGKKMVVVVDRAFFDSLGEMDYVADLSNADIAWFIVRFEEVPGERHARLKRDEVRYCTLERSVEGLTGGRPVTKARFEERIARKMR